MTQYTRELDRPIDLLALHRANPARYPHLLQSAAYGQYDILFAFPGDSLVLHPDGSLTGPDAHSTSQFLDALDSWVATESTAVNEVRLPFCGGWFVYLSYELAGQIEPVVQMPPADKNLPVAFATRFATAVILDRHNKTAYMVAEAGSEALLESMSADVNGLKADHSAADFHPVQLLSCVEDEPQRFLDSVARIHRYIVEGDVFQVNLSRRWTLMLADEIDPAIIYSNLCIKNPAPFGGIARWHDAAIISSSPERLVSVRNGIAETRPIAGTRPRAANRQHDRDFSAALLASSKERAEHIMLIDLERNDLGRICVPGTIEVNELMALESHTHVHHIVSNVRGTLRDDVTPGQVIRAMFPGGTITGCPKVRTMEIIAELERCPRGAYTGSMGYLGLNGNMDMNILIRTMVSQGRELVLRAGAGIVADSLADAELDETRAKARGLLHALGLDAA